MIRSRILFTKQLMIAGFLALGLLGLPVQQAFSQEKATYTLQEAIDQALNKGWETQKAQKDTEIAKADFARTKSTYLPQVSLSETGVLTNSPLQSFGILLNQSKVTQNDFNPSLLNSPDAITNFNTRLSVQQPIFNAEGYYGRKAAQAQIQAREQMQQHTKQGTILQVKQAYFQLQLAQESQEVLKKAIEAALANETLTKQNLEQGYVQNADLMAVQVRVLALQNQLADAENQLQNATDFLAYLLNLPEGTEIIATDKLNENVALTALSNELSTQRSDFKAQQYAIKAREQMLLSHKKSILPQLNAFGAFEFNDDIPFGVGANNYLLGFQLQWDIFRGYDRIAKTQRASAELDKSRIEYDQNVAQSHVELKKAQRNVQLASQKLNTTKMAVQQAEEVLRIRQDRYQEGLEKTSDVLTAEAQVAEKKLEYLQNLYAQQMAVFYLEFLTETP